MGLTEVSNAVQVQHLLLLSAAAATIQVCGHSDVVLLCVYEARPALTHEANTTSACHEGNLCTPWGSARWGAVKAHTPPPASYQPCQVDETLSAGCTLVSQGCLTYD